MCHLKCHFLDIRWTICPLAEGSLNYPSLLRRWKGGGGFRRGRAPLRDSFWKFDPEIEQFNAWKGFKTAQHSKSYLKPTISAKRRNFQIFYEEIKKNHYQGWVGVSFFPSIYQKIVYPPRGRGLFCKIYTLGPIN